MGKSTKKETDFWGNEKEVHYEDGKKVGETKYRETFWGDKVQDHYDSSGNKTGETRREEAFFSDKAVHYDSEGKKTGYTKNDETLFGSKIQRHYDTSGHQVGKSHYEEGFFGGHKKVHDGEYFKGSSGGGQGSSTSGASYSDSSSASGFGLAFLILICIIIGTGVVSVVIDKTRDGYRSEPFMNRSDTPIKSESEQMRERDEPYRKVVNGKSESDKEAIAAIYLTRPYEYECDINAVDKQINYYDNFVQQYPGSIYVPEALMSIAWHQLYALQCDINEADKLARIEKAKICYRKIYTESKNDNWRIATIKLIDVLTNNENRLSKITIEHSAYDEVLVQHSNLLNQLPLCSRN